MYDPEYSLRLQRHLDVIRTTAAKAAEIMGNDNLVIQFVEAMNSAMELLVARVLDYDECFDPEQQVMIQSEIMVMLKELSEITDEIGAIERDLGRI